TRTSTDSGTLSATDTPGTESATDTRTSTDSNTLSATDTAGTDTGALCSVDEDLGPLTIGQAETRILEVAQSADDQAGDCGSGPDMVVRLELDQHADLDVSVLQFGDHLVGLYRDVGGACTDWSVFCFDLASQKSASTVWQDLEPGVYYVIVEGRDAIAADTVVLTLTMRTSACGNGNLDADEECDDGNFDPDDGCSPLCLIESGECTLDEDIGLLNPSVLVQRSLDMVLYGDEWVTECAPYGYDYVMSFTTNRIADIVLSYSQQGSHAVGLYEGGQVEQFLCQARGGVCLAREPGQSGTVTFRSRTAGTYYLIGESVGYEEAGILDLRLRISGCLPDEDLGILSKTTPLSRSGSTLAGSAIFEAGCGGTSGNEIVYAFELDRAARVNLSFEQEGDHVFGLFSEQGGDCDANQVGCLDPGGEESGTTSFARLAAGNYLLIVDAYDPGLEGAFQFSLNANK
ncbi:MAG: hypothetical protein MUC50_13945, partial [Myxococcota bacterium]|nr:hypothetical protein [Myxococcota bacterium]